MAKKIWILLSCILCICCVPAITAKAEGDVIENEASGIPDPVLYGKILETLGKNKGDKFTRQEAESIERIYFGNFDEKIGTFQGIAYLKNLKDLKVFEITTGNLEEIAAGAPNLERLVAQGYDTQFANHIKEEDRRQIDSLKALKNMKRLVYLNVSYNKLTSFDGVEGLENLEILLAGSNRICGAGEIEKLANLKKLRELNLSENQLTEVKGIGGLESLNSLYLYGNSLETPGEVKDLKNLTILDMSRNRLKNINGLRYLHRLKYLWLSENFLKNIAEIVKMKCLVELSVSDNQIKIFPSLKVLKNLEYLDAEDNKLNSCPKLKKHKNLKKVRLSWNYLKKKDIKNNLPKKFWNSTALMESVWKEQKGNIKIYYKSPKKKSKITKNTKKITGEVAMKKYNSSLSLYLRFPDGDTYRKISGDTGWKYPRKNGKYKFTLRGLDLKEYAGKEVELRLIIGGTLADFTIDRFTVQE